MYNIARNSNTIYYYTILNVLEWYNNKLILLDNWEPQVFGLRGDGVYTLLWMKNIHQMV